MICAVFVFKSECNDGHYGLNCRKLCSGHCENNGPCDHVVECVLVDVRMGIWTYIVIAVRN